MSQVKQSQGWEGQLAPAQDWMAFKASGSKLPFPTLRHFILNHPRHLKAYLFTEQTHRLSNYEPTVMRV